MSRDRSLAKVIPRDRRRLKSAVLVVTAMILGAGLLWARRRLFARPASARPAAETVVIQRFAPVIDDADVTSPREGAVVSDGRPDFAFELLVDGPVLGIVVAHTDVHGSPAPGSLRWGTTDLDLLTFGRTSPGHPGFRAWQLAVTDGERRLDDSIGAIAPLERGTHRLRVHLSPAVALNGGGYLRAYVIGPDRVAASAPVFVPGEPTPKPAPTAWAPVDSSEPIHLPPRPFDRGAAIATLNGVQFERCTKLVESGSMARVEVTFAPSGAVSTATVLDGPITLHPAAGRCVSEEVKKQATVPAFDGAPMRTTKTFWVGDRPPGRRH